jgi:two-component system sensor histidine kinase CpxA
VAELLSLAQFENRKTAPQLAPVQLNEMIQDLIKISTVEAAARDCRLVWSADRDVTIEGDRELLRRAVENVIRNAVRYAPDGSDILVSLHSDGTATRISIRDFGSGVPPDSLIRIFDPFYRIDHARNRETGGSGLGLAIAQKAVEIHGGRISARNAAPG